MSRYCVQYKVPTFWFYQWSVQLWFQTEYLFGNTVGTWVTNYLVGSEVK